MSRADGFAVLAAVLVGIGAFAGGAASVPVPSAPPLEEVSDTGGAPAPCPPPPGLARPTSPVVAADLDPELVGTATPWVEGAPPEWTESGLAQVAQRAGASLYCDEYPCFLEVRAPDETPNVTGDAIDADAVLEEIRAGGWPLGDVMTSIHPVTRADGTREEVLLVPLRPAGEPTPSELLREEVRRFWLQEAR